MLLFCSIVILLLSLLWWYDSRKHAYWKNNNVKSPPYEFVLGHARFLHFGKNSRHLYYDKLYKRYYEDGMCGIYDFFSPVLLVFDEDLYNHIFVKDFDHFRERWSFSFNSKGDQFLGSILPMLKGDRWKEVKSVITPAFSPAKIRTMHPLMANAVNILISELEEKSGTNIATLQNMSQLTLNIITNCAFGIDLKQSPEKLKEVSEHARKAFPFFDVKKIPLNTLFPRLFTFLGLRMSAPAFDYFENLSREILVERKKSTTFRGDFVDILLNSMKKDNTSINEHMVIAQSIVFLIAGHETSSVLLSFAFYSLAKHQHIQEKVRKEIETIEKTGDEFTYDGIMQSVYLEAFVNETLRLYPLVAFIPRMCEKDYELPNKSLIIPSGMTIAIPAWSIHRDEKYYDNPEEFNPDRFTNAKMKKETMSFLGFGGGPRACIGRRIAMMEIKLTLAKIISKFKVQFVGDQTLEVKSSLFFLKPKSEIYLRFISI